MGALSYDKQWLDITNKALALIGANGLTSFEEGTTEQSISVRLLPLAVSDVYSQYAWKSALKSASLAPDARLNPDGSYVFVFPSDFARLSDVKVEDGYSWKMSRKGIVTFSPSVIATYSALPEYGNDVPEVLLNLIVLKLASLMAIPLMHDSTSASRLDTQFNTAYAKALLEDNVPFDDGADEGQQWYEQAR